MTPKQFFWKRITETARSLDYQEPAFWQIEKGWIDEEVYFGMPITYFNPWLDVSLWRRAVQELTGTQFEWFLVGLFQFLRFHARATQRSHDAGVDLVVRTPAGKVAIQAKLWDSPIGRKAVLEVVAGKLIYRADHGAVFAPNGFRKSAKSCAKELHIELFDLNRLFGDVAHWPQLFVASFLGEAMGADTLGNVYLHSDWPTTREDAGVYFHADELRPVDPLIALREACQRGL